MRIAKTFITATLLLFLLASCGSTPPSDYYLLSEEATGTPGSSGPAIGIGPIDIPDYLQRNIMVVNEERYQLQLDATSRWAEQLDAGILRVMTLNLAILLDTQQIQRFPWRRDSPPDYGVSINIINLRVDGTQAHLAAEWTLKNTRAQADIAQKISQFYTSMPSADAAGVAASYSSLLLQLSEEIAQEIRKHRAAGSTSQPAG
ncbi:membrane integrity-associated transporter subunit PqiC [Halieaceae bacterium IMCC14734]|uniref:Membrane integrity-associated transporter subunit PqiC n=1 Tax=Candidatus Litorirhabdus singularis TaxID=2518993 RepID=A0ABT3TIY7_9GAMM|nr:PqiC family protein [Candidatus Litorirhabdus singularis]MCX2982170.1 membrane integrity-associated transporter subunit PqiC [Candidatus Litorirhabdus singularis]